MVPGRLQQVIGRTLATIIGVVTVLACVTFSGPRAQAMSVTPIHIEMKSAGRYARSQVKVTNTGKTALPVEIQMQKFTMSATGSLKRTKAEDNFLVFPPTALIKPGASQVFRIQWVGEPLLKRSESYMMSVNQLPVKLPKGKNTIQLVMSFGVNINVAPPKGQPALSLVETGIAKLKGGKRYPTVTIANTRMSTD